MAISMAWCAVRGKPAQAVLQDLKLSPTGDRQDQLNCPFNGLSLGGWYLVVADHVDTFLDEAPLARISAGAEAITLGIDEAARSSVLRGWRDGRELWSVAHASDKGPDHLAQQGAVPAELAALLARPKAEIPPALGRALTGYHHDDPPEAHGGENCYEILAPTG